MVTLFLHYLLVKKVIVVEGGHCNRGGRQHLLNVARIVTDEEMANMMKVSAHLTQEDQNIPTSK